jgi:hypothetical protein
MSRRVLNNKSSWFKPGAFAEYYKNYREGNMGMTHIFLLALISLALTAQQC